MVGNHGRRALVVDHEAEVRLVEAHPESGRCHQCLDAVVEQCLLQLLPAFSRLSRAGLHVDPARLEPLRHPVRVADGQRIDDSVAGKQGNLLREPREALRLSGQPYGLKPERRAMEIASQHAQVRAEHDAKVRHDPVIRGRRRGEQPQVPGQRTGDSLNEAIVGPDVVPPVRDAMGLVDDQ